MAVKKIIMPPRNLVGGAAIDYFTVRQFDGSKTIGLVILVASLVVITLIILYIIYLIKNQNFARQVIINGSINIADPKNQAQSVNLTASVSNAVTYSFWVYLYNYVPQGYATEPGLVWLGYAQTPTTSTSNSGPNNITNISPMVFMDSSTNRMYCSFYLANGNQVASTFALSSLIPSKTNLAGDIRTESKNLSYVTIPIDYVPLQRWVHVALVINQSTISIYQDATVYAVRSVSDLDGINQVPPNKDLQRPLFNVGTPTSFMTTPVTSTMINVAPTIVNPVQQQNMYMSSFLYYNYALAQADILAIYNSGPNAVSGWFSWLGIGYWKFQSPLVRIPDSAINGGSTADDRGSFS